MRTAAVVGLGTAAAGTLGLPEASAAAAPGADGSAARTHGTRPPVRTGTALDHLPHPLIVGHRGAGGYRPRPP
ncbi:hypothetical protein [Peterkaempfera sp. SMS 1(5)a]|uniref:hypothetical protein n=1 Tax=Peterkaempfera podocarpi TaxID=3232308 RepID=UPI00366D8E2D